MTGWLLAGLALYFVQIMIPSALFQKKLGVEGNVGPRDDVPEPDVRTARARRALANMKENLPFFLTLGVLALVVPGANLGLASAGAAVFVIARAIYVPLYLFGVPWWRTVAYVLGLAGCGMMALALL